ncbi:MAG TPA: rhomboid family intramembrane serine protease [Terriglobales bacterium]|nr:rhomboid family intramembrane serine protease [Terriglobales bacterium]
MPHCAQCERELPPDAVSTLCDNCRQRDFAIQAEASATDESQQHFWLTNAILAINVIVFVLMVWKHVSFTSPTSDQVVRWGANFGPLTLGGQSWRLLSNIFVHIGIAHLVANMWALIVLGRLAEALYGRIAYLSTYLFAGIVGSLATLLWNPLSVSAGASGALFGISGALIATLYVGKLPLPRRVIRPVLLTLVLWAAFDLAYGFVKPGVDNAAHIGGFFAGLLVGIPLGHHLGPERKSAEFRERLAIIALLFLAALTFITWKTQGYIVAAERARQAIAANKPDDALALLKPIELRKPKDPLVHLYLADAYLRKSDLPSAEREYKILLTLTPKNLGIWYNLATVYIQQQRWEEAATAYTHAAEAGLDTGASWYNAGLMYRQADKRPQALAAFQKAVAKNQFFEEAWLNLGIEQVNARQPAEAVKSLQKAIQLRPADAEAHLWYGNALLATRQEEPSRQEFLKAYQLRAAQQKILREQMLQQQRQQQKASQPSVAQQPK